MEKAPSEEALFDPPAWMDVLAKVDTDDGLTPEQVHTWGLVLLSQHIPTQITHQTDTWQLWVPAPQASEALAQLKQYETENAGWALKALSYPQFEQAATTTALVALVLGLFHTLTHFYLSGFGHDPIRWVRLGNAYAGLIMQGQWWRTITALTLHADATHIIGNLAIGGFFITWLCKELGGGLGWGLVLLSGILGNLINAYVQVPLHQSIGASTAVFGAIGLLSGLRFIERRHYTLKDQLIPPAAGLMLLGLLGTGGERTDIGAHLFGLFSGTGLGMATGYWLRSHKLPSLIAQRYWGWGAGLTVILAWLIALWV